MDTIIVIPPIEPEDNDSGKKKQKRWYKRPPKYNNTAWETRKLVRVTVFLGVVTLLAVEVGISQAIITRNAIVDSDSTSARQIRILLSQAKAAEAQADNSRLVLLKQDTFSHATLDSSGRQIAVARETMEKSLRPYIAFTAVLQVRPDTLEVGIENFGATPAYIIRTFFDFGFRDTGDELPLSSAIARSDTLDNSVILVKGATPMAIGAPLNDWNKARLQDVKHQKTLLYEWGFVEYRDVFNVKRRCSFKWESSKYDVYSMTPCHDGNDCK